MSAFWGLQKFTLFGMTVRMALIKWSLSIHKNLLQFNRSTKNLIILKETSKAGKTSQMIVSKIHVTHLSGAHVSRLYARYYLVSASSTPALLCSVMLGLGVCELPFPGSPASWLPVTFCQNKALSGVQKARRGVKLFFFLSLSPSASGSVSASVCILTSVFPVAVAASLWRSQNEQDRSASAAAQGRGPRHL